jgi:hypothetical protein
MALGPRRPPQTVAAAAISPPLDSQPRCPPSTASTGYKGSPTPREQPFFLPPVTPTTPPCFATVEPPCSAAHGPPLSSPLPPRASHRCVPPSFTTSRRPSTPDAAPAVVPLRPTAHHHGAHPSGEAPPFLNPQPGVPYCRATLAPLLYGPFAGTPEPARPLPAPLLAEHAALFSHDGPPAQSGWASRSRPAEFGPFAQYHLPFSIRLNID